MSEPPTRIPAPAKVNLTLAVLGGRGPDGYHQLRGVFARLALADELVVVDRGAPDGPDTLLVRPRPTGGGHEADLVLRATAALRTWAGTPLPRLDLALRKRIPVAGGLGGGSSDGAAALRLAADAWGLRVPDGDLRAIASGLGADVPFFLAASPVALVGGRGERIEPLPSRAIAGTGVLLVSRAGKPSTGDVFAAHEALGSSAASQALETTDRLVGLLRAQRSDRALPAMAAELRDANDLYPAAATVMPWLPGWRATVEDLLGRPALLSGAGPTLAVFYASAAEAERARRTFARRLGSASDGTADARVIATAIATQRGGTG